MTDSKDNGGPAFPSGNDVSVGIYTSSGHAGMTLRDWFASQCPRWYLDAAMPTTVGGVRDMLIAKGIIPRDRANEDPLRSYSTRESTILQCRLQYEYADLMLEARK